MLVSVSCFPTFCFIQGCFCFSDFNCTQRNVLLLGHLNCMRTPVYLGFFLFCLLFFGVVFFFSPENVKTTLLC